MAGVREALEYGWQKNKNKIKYISKIEFSAKRLWVGRVYNIYIL